MCREDSIIEERPEMREESPAKRVDKIFEQIRSKFREQPPTFLLCVLPDRKSDICGLRYVATLQFFCGGPYK
jgi:eukaryotic translation initiation factor 2C